MDPQLAMILQLLRQQQNPAAANIAGLATNTGVNALNNAQNQSLGFPTGGSLSPNASTMTQTAAPLAPTPAPTVQTPPPVPMPTSQPVTSPNIGAGMLASNPFQQSDGGMLTQSPLGGPLGQALPNSLTQNLFGVGGSSMSPSQAYQFAVQ
jgi:hypothetical protein